MDPKNSRFIQRIRRWSRRTVITLAIVFVVLLAARIALPLVIKRQVNHRLQSIPGYVGNVDRIGIHLWRGAYSLHGVAIFKQTGEVREPFVVARDIDFSLAWRELFHRKIVSDILVTGGEITVVKGTTEESSQKDIDRRWQSVIKDLFPIDITHFELKDGLVRYQDKTRDPPVDVFIKNMRVVATGLRNRAGEQGLEFPAQITVDGDSLGDGKLHLQLEAEPLADQPHFHASAKLDQVNLPALNQSLKAYANVDVGRGTFRMVAEMAGRDGGFQGYVKPFFEDLDFHNVEDKDKGIGSRLWEKVVSGLAWLVKNKPRDQVATRIPFEGRFGDPKVGMWTTVANLFRHGFIRAFNPTVEGTVHANNVLPNGQSADGKNVAATKTDSPAPEPPATPDQKAGAPTGRPTARPPK